MRTTTELAAVVFSLSVLQLACRGSCVQLCYSVLVFCAVVDCAHGDKALSIDSGPSVAVPKVSNIQ